MIPWQFCAVHIQPERWDCLIRAVLLLNLRETTAQFCRSRWFCRAAYAMKQKTEIFLAEQDSLQSPPADYWAVTIHPGKMTLSNWVPVPIWKPPVVVFILQQEVSIFYCPLGSEIVHFARSALCSNYLWNRLFFRRFSFSIFISYRAGREGIFSLENLVEWIWRRESTSLGNFLNSNVAWWKQHIG